MDNLSERIIKLGNYIAESGATVRQTAEKFGISKSTVHKDVSERLEYTDRALFIKVRGVLDLNKAERHLRGGLATKEKYERLKNAEKISG